MGRSGQALTLALTLAAPACSYRLVHDDRLNAGAIERLVARTAATRHLALKTNLAVELVAADVLRAEVLRQFRDAPERAKLRPYGLLLKRFGLLPAEMDLEAYLVDLLSEQIAGYYDPETKVLRLIEGSTDLGGTLALLEKILRRDLAGEFLVGHELAHALDDQHFDLARFTQFAANGDVAAARKAFVEGEAMLVGMNVVLRRTLKPVSYTGAAEKPDAAKKWDQVPPVIKRQILFEYLDGLNFANAVYHAGGTRALDGVYARPPSSTEEILHPAKYLRRDDAPRAVSFSVDPPALAALERVDEDTLGELGVLSLLEVPLGEAGAKAAAGGWGGDRFRLYLVPGRPNDVGFAWRTVWDSPADRVEFAANLGRAIEVRYGAPVTATERERHWATPAGTWRIVEHEPDVVDVDLIPNLADAK